MSSEDDRPSSDQENSSDSYTKDPLDDVVIKHMKIEKKKQADYESEDSKESGESSTEDNELDDPVVKDTT